MADRRLLVSRLHGVADRIAAEPVQIEDAHTVQDGAEALSVVTDALKRVHESTNDPRILKITRPFAGWWK